jgi:serine/threonine protein kinase
VHIACLKKFHTTKFALKFSRLKDSDIEDPYTETSSSWYELWFLKDIFKPIIEANICPNLPLLIDTFLCEKHDFFFRRGKRSHPCIVMAVELASGDLKDYFTTGGFTDNEMYSALFQIMAGLHGIQMNGQILHNDIKASNILFYNVKPGGYWHYRINNRDFYVPNYGKLFILNDFGVSTLYSPNFQLFPSKDCNEFNLGSRYAININDKFYPLEASVEYRKNCLKKATPILWLEPSDTKESSKYSHGVKYKINRNTGVIYNSRTLLTPHQKSYLFGKGITTNPKRLDFFDHPSVIPPFEFYNDVQDVLRTFVGGKRTTQRGVHRAYKTITHKIRNVLQPYMGSAENTKSNEFSSKTYHVLAGSFIVKFFTHSKNYTLKPGGHLLDSYNMDEYVNLKE